MSAIRIGIRTGITMKVGQAAWHRQSSLPEKAVCGKQINQSSVRPIERNYWYRRCTQCFDKHLGEKLTKDMFGWTPPPPLDHHTPKWLENILDLPDA